MHRRCPLWPETVQAIQEAIRTRPQPDDSEHEDRLFITSHGKLWVQNGNANNPLSREFRKLLNTTGSHRHRLGFYALRHTFETIGGDSRDQVAVDHIMGHVDGSMAAQYRERIDDSRLRAVVDHVHQWLFKKS